MRKKLRRFLSVLLCAAVLIGSAVPAVAEEGYEYDEGTSYTEELDGEPEVSEPEPEPEPEPTPEPEPAPQEPTQDAPETPDASQAAKPDEAAPTAEPAASTPQPTAEPQATATPQPTAAVQPTDTPQPTVTPTATPEIALLAADVSAPVISVSSSGPHDAGRGIYCEQPSVTISDDAGLASITVREYTGEYEGTKALASTYELPVTPGDTVYAYTPGSKGAVRITAVDMAGNETTREFFWGHMLGTRKILEIPATCEENHKQVHMYWCAICGREYVNYEIVYDEEESDRAPGHRFGEKVTFDGCGGKYTRQVCNACGYVDQELIEPSANAAGHVYDDAAPRETTATCTHGGYAYRECVVCGYDDEIEGSYTPATGHSFGAWKSTKEPTCTDEGERMRACQNEGCSESETMPVAPLGHRMMAKTVTPALCKTPGLETDFCVRCGMEGESREIPPIGSHLIKNWTTLEGSTCIEPGVESGVCERCGEEETRLILTLEHVVSSWTTDQEATCISEGQESGTCDVCGQRVTRATKRASHLLSDWTTLREATCTAFGEQAGRCSVCGGEVHAVIPARGHRMGPWETLIAATCTEEGLESRSCTVCDEEELRQIGTQGGHVADKENYDCTKPLVCKNCGVEMGEALFKAHFPNKRLSADADGHWYKCGNDGCAVKVGYEAHTVKGDGNCLTAERCSVCGETVTPAQTAHRYDGEWVATATRHYRLCSNGDCTKYSTVAAHTGADDSDCTTAYVCRDCGYEIRPAKLEHSFTGAWITDADTHKRACANDGCKATTDAEAHAGADDGDPTTALLCGACGYELIAAVPAAPVISTLVNTASGVQIGWNPVEAAAEYHVLYRTDGGWADLGKTAGTSYTMNSADSGTAYTFTVQGYSAAGAPGLYDADGESLTFLAQPQRPTVQNTADGMQVSWNAVAGAQSYRLLYKENNGSWSRLLDTTQTSYTYKNAKAGAKYGFTVQAIGEGGAASTYDQTGTAMLNLAVPAAPTATISESTVTVTWKATSGAAKYRLLLSTNGGAFTTLTDTAATSYTWTGAKAGSTYVFAVQAIAAGGELSGYLTNGKSVTCLAQPALPAVENAANGMKLTWSAVAGAKTYRIYYKTGTGAWTKLTDAAATAYTWTGAKSGTKYTYSVQAIAADGSLSAYNQTGKALTYVAQPGVPTAALSSGTIKLTWSKATGAKTYRVYYKAGSGAWTKLADTSSTTYSWKGFNAGTAYSFTVQAMDGANLSSYDATGRAYTVPAKPALPNIGKLSNGFALTWSPAAGAAKYRVYYKAGSGAWTKLAETSATSYNWTGAKSGTKYTFSVEAISAQGAAGGYNTTGKSAMILSQPSLPSLSKVSGGIKVSWGKAAGASKYRVYYKVGSGGWTKLTDTTSTSYTLKNVKKGTKYTFSIQAIGSDGTTSTYNTTGKTLTY